MASATAQTYDGPRPAKPDLPYLKHASNLIATEAATAQENKKRDDTLYSVEGLNSPVATPLATPIFLMQSEKLDPRTLGLFKMEAKNNRREILLNPKKKVTPIRIEATRLTPDNIWRLEVEESLDPGEYCLTPDGSNQVFCFQVR